MNVEFGNDKFPSIKIEVNKKPILDGIVNGIINIEDSLKVALLNTTVDIKRLDEIVAIILYDGELYKIIPIKNTVTKIPVGVSINDEITKISKMSINGLMGMASSKIIDSLNHNNNISGDVVVSVNKSLKIYLGYLKFVEPKEENTINV